MSRRLVCSAVAAAAALVLVFAECPNACSGHGECDINDSCACYVGYQAADCSERRCPSGLAFVDAPRGDLNHDGKLGGVKPAATAVSYSKVQWSRYKQYEYWPNVAPTLAYKTVANDDLNPLAINAFGWKAEKDEAHFPAECSGKGACNRDIGLCECFSGYTGAACHRTSCPNDCSGHGICRTVAEVARGRLNSHFVESFGGVNMYEGVQSAFTYRLWDADKHQTCACDPGYTGSDCSLRECAHGDDPLTDTADMCGNEACRDEVQGFSIAVASNTDKTYRIRFYDYFGRTFVTNDFVIKTAGTDAANSANAQAVKYALQALPSNVTGLVTVSSTKNKFNNIRVLVTFTTLSGNVPEFDVVPGVVNGGAVAVAQPRQPVQLVSFSATPPTTHTVSLQLYPKDNTGFQALQFVGASTDNLPAAESTDAERTAKAAVFSQALMTGASASSAFVYEFGTVANNDNGVNVAYNTDSGTYDFQVVMPNKNWGSVPMKVTINAVSATVTVDTRDGNREHSMCSNRGTCDFTTGMCNCFGGYTGGACQLQNVLAF